MEADAFRNLRASLLGLHGPKGPVVTMLVTSAKPGEGKSTTALNLAVTCAKAGERTLLIDCDLRRPSLRPVFLDDSEDDFGLVDVLRGDLPWQRAVIRGGEANLDFLSSGDPRGVPIEILGTIELRQLITALSGHYHRVILDGPAVLGMADCRMLGRMVDAVFLVVRSGAHGLNPIDRATEMLLQSRVPLAGYVFNGLDHDLQNWASHASVPLDKSSDPDPRRGLDAPRSAVPQDGPVNV
jgi:capsular exopolysaccharide synthesis family protein